MTQGKNRRKPFSRPTWVEINLKHLAGNFRAVKKWAGKNVSVMGIVKADAYGHGATQVARTLQKESIDFFAVASLDEAMEIHRAGIRKPVLILGYTPPEYMKEVIRYNFHHMIFDISSAQHLNRAARQMNRAANVHIKIDTGMGRLGVFPEEAPAFIQKIKSMPFLRMEGISTHFAAADGDGHYTKKQLAAFHSVLRNLKQENISVPFVHASNSAGLINFKDACFNMVRPGILLYGLSPLSGNKNYPFTVQPVLSLKTRIISLKSFPARSRISYGGRYSTRTHGEKICVVPIGYADGYLRALSNRSRMIVRGKKVPVIGKICMDFTLLNVTHVRGVKIHDEVTVIGRSGKTSVTVNELAAIAKTINYEITCLIGKRVPRVYL